MAQSENFIAILRTVETIHLYDIYQPIQFNIKVRLRNKDRERIAKRNMAEGKKVTVVRVERQKCVERKYEQRNTLSSHTDKHKVVMLGRVLKKGAEVRANHFIFLLKKN